MNRQKIGLVVILFALGVIAQIFLSRNSGEEKMNVPEKIEIEAPEPDTSVLDLRTGKEWMPVPVTACQKTTERDKNWIRTKYIITLENGAVMGSDRKVEVGSKNFCWMNMWYQTKGENMDSLVFYDPYIEEKKL